MSAKVIMRGVLDMQVCVPAEWDDGAVVRFANICNPAGTSGGWMIRKARHPLNEDDPERGPCSQSPDHVHIMLEC